MKFVAAAVSFIVPGLGQALRGRWVEAVLFLMTVGYIRLLLAGLAGGAVEDGRLLGFLFGAFGVKGGLGNPTFVVFTVLTVVLHGYAAWHAYLSNERAAIRTISVDAAE